MNIDDLQIGQNPNPTNPINPPNQIPNQIPVSNPNQVFGQTNQANFPNQQTFNPAPNPQETQIIDQLNNPQAPNLSA